MTQDELDMCETIRKEMEVQPEEVDDSLVFPPAEINEYEDEMPYELRKMSEKGFVSASVALRIMSQATQAGPTTSRQVKQKEETFRHEDIFIEKGFLTQLEALDKKSQASCASQKPKVVRTIADAVIEDFEDIDNATLTIIDEIIILDKSLGKLTEKLNSSQRAAELMESALSQTASHTKLDVTSIDLEAMSSDEDHNDNNKNTEDLERSFFNFKTQKEPMQSPEVNKECDFLMNSSQHKPFLDTEALETNFLNLETQKETKPQASQQLQDNNLQMSSGIGNTGMFSGFSFASGNTREMTSDPPVFVGFGLASGKATEFNLAKINEIARAFEEKDRQLEIELLKNEEKFQTPVPIKRFRYAQSTSSTPGSSRIARALIPSPLASIHEPSHSQSLQCSTRDFSPLAVMQGFTKASGKSIQVNTEHLKKFQDVFTKEERKFAQQLEEEDNFETPEKPPKKFCLNPASGKINEGKEAAKIIDARINHELKLSQSTSREKPPKKKIRLDFGESPSSPFPMNRFSKGINLHSTPLVIRNSGKLSDMQENLSIKQLFDTFDDSELNITPTKKMPVKSRLLSKFNDSVDSEESLNLKDIESLEQEISLNYKVSEKVKILRRQALEEQKAFIKEKSECDRTPMAGSIFMMKSAKNRKTLKEYVNGAEPKNLLRHFITINNATDFRFSMKNYLDDETWKSNTAGISVGDNARLFFDEFSRVGIDEIRLSFLASPGVDPKLATNLWIENTYKMLVFKLSWLENSFESFEKFELLTPENALLQMKYRYDREQDRSHRSAIKKIVELDDVSCRRMVLKVAGIVDSPGIGFELDLTDGWYLVKATIDSSLADAVERGKIQTGTKIITSYAEIIGCSGFDPLDMPSSVRLRIHGNSTRKVNWDMKMGFSKNPSPISIRLDSVLATGGLIGKLQLLVTHVYQLIYVDSSGEKKGEFVALFNDESSSTVSFRIPVRKASTSNSKSTRCSQLCSLRINCPTSRERNN